MAFSTTPVAPVSAAQLVDEVRRRVDLLRPRVRLPADDADPAARADALVAEDLGERPRPVAWLARQAEVLEQVRGASAAARRRPCP